MADLALVLVATAGNPDVGDLEVANTDVAMTTGVRATMQDVFIRLRFWAGEWFLDRTLGIPYLQRVLVANPNLSAISAMFRRVILGTPGVASLSSFNASVDRARRVLTVTFAGRTTDGSELTTSSYVPFVVAF